MFELMGKRLFEAMCEAAEGQLGTDHPCAQAVARATKSGAETEIAAAQEQLAALPVDAAASLMEVVHKAMREDPAAILEAWDGPCDPRRSN